MTAHRHQQDASSDVPNDHQQNASKCENGTKQEPIIKSTHPSSLFTRPQKALLIAIVSVAATFSGFSSNIYFPSIPTIASDLSVSTELINLTVTTYLIFQGLSPSIWGAFADVRGRRITYICTFIIYIGACIGLAETQRYAQLIVLRCLQSTGSASTIAIGAGVIGDITTREERGGYMGFFQAGLLAPLAIGPILGGIFAETLGWRAIFWFLTIYAGVVLTVLILILPETLPAKVGDGSLPIKRLVKFMQQRPVDKTGVATPSGNKAHVNILGSLRILLHKEVSFAIIFLSICYTIWQMTIVVMSSLFKSTYELNDIQIGLTFVGNGIGSIIGTLLTGKLLDYDYRRIKKQYAGPPEDFPLERARLQSIWFYSALQCASLIVFGWTIDKHVHISVPIITTFFSGWAATSIQSVITTFLVDAFPKQSASATAALNLSRCLICAGGTAAVLPIINAISVGWTFTLFTGVQILALGLIVVQMRYGAEWRKVREQREENIS